MTLKNLYDAFKIFSDYKSSDNDIYRRGVDNLANASIEVVNIYNSINDISKAFSSGGVVQGLKAAGTSLAQGAGALIKAHPVIASLIALYAVAKVFDTFVADADEKFEDASEAVSTYQTTKDEIESINSELDNTKKQIDELNAKQTLSLVEQDELDKLTRTNDELERQLKIKQTLEESQKNTARDEVNDFLNNRTNRNKDYNTFDPRTWFDFSTTQQSLYDPNYVEMVLNESMSDALKNGGIFNGRFLGTVDLNPMEAIASHLRGLEALQAEITELEQKAANSTDAKEVEKLQKQIDSKNSNLADETSWLNNAFQDISDITNDFDKSYFSNLEDYNRVMDSLNQFNDFLGVSGSKTQSKLSGIFEIQELKDADTQQALVDYVNALKDVSEFDINSGSLNSVKGIERLRTALSEADIEADDLYQYLKAIADDGSYDLNEVGKQLSESLTKVNEDSKNSITEFINGLSEDELTAVAEIKANPEIDTSQWDIDTWRNQIQQYLDGNPISIDVVLEDFNSKIDDIQSVYSTLVNAVKEYNKYGAYTLDTLQSLLALEPEYLAMLVTENGQLGINKDTMMQLINTQIEDAKTKLYQAAARDINALSVSNESTNLQNNTEDLDNNTTATYNNTVAKAAQSALGRGVSQEDINEVWNRYSPLIDNLNNFQSNLQSNLSYALGGGSTSSDASEKIADIQRQIDELEKSMALDNLKYKFDSLEHSITKVDNALSILNDMSDLTYENDYIGKIELTTQQMDLAQSKAELLANEFKELQNSEYNSGDQAAELASRMQSVADSINENQKQIIEYGRNVTTYYASALTSLTSLSDTSLSKASNLIDRNIKTLSEGGLTGLQFSFAPSVPQSAVEKQRKENQTLQEEMQSYYTAVENMQKISLDLQYQEQMADNERKKADLLETLNEQKQALNSYFIEVETTQKTSNANVENQLSTHTSNITTQVSGLVQNVKTMVSELNSWLIDNPIKPSVSSSVFASEVGKVQGTVGDGSAQDIVEIAKQYVGKSEFKHGNTGETISAKDACQAFVATVYEAAGVNTSYTSKGTAAEARKAWGTHPIVEDGSGYIDYSDIPVGAVIYSQAGSDKRGHVSIYIGNGQIIEAGGSTVQIRNLNDTLSNRVYYSWGFNGNVIPQYAKGTKDYGIAGENYRREYAINKKTGEWHLIDEPTLFDKKEYDIVGEKVSAKIDKKIPKYATGTPISDPEVRKMVKAASDETGVPVNIILAVIDQESSNTWIDRKADSNGYSYGYIQLYDKGSLSALSEERRQAAMTDPAANIEEGAKYLKQMYDSTNDWTSALSAYNQGLSGYKRNGINSYGTNVFTKANSQAFVQAANEISGISSDVSSIAGSTASVAQSTDAMASVNFQQELKNLIDSDVQVDPDKKVVYQGDMLEYIKQNANIQEQDSDDFLSSWESLNSWYQDAQDMFNWYQDRLIENRNTEDFAKISKYATSAANDYTRDSINAQANITLQGLEDKYNNGKNLRDAAVQYYYDEKAKGASADELVTIVDAINTMDENLESISDEYVSVSNSLKEYLVGRAEREMQVYDDQISWQNKNNQYLQRQLENTKSLDAKMALGDAIISGEINKKNIYEQQNLLTKVKCFLQILKIFYMINFKHHKKAG